MLKHEIGITDDLINSLVNDLFETCAEEKYISEIEKKYNVSIYLQKEKHNSLQYTFYYTIEFEECAEHLFVEIEDGINNGTVLLNQEWGGSVSSTCEVEVLSDITPDIKKMSDFFMGKSNFGINISIAEARGIAEHFGVGKEVLNMPLNLINALIIFKDKKSEILRLYKERSYDNYVTGGGTSVTDKNYKYVFEKYHEQGIFWICQYKTVEADRNFR